MVGYSLSKEIVEKVCQFVLMVNKKLLSIIKNVESYEKSTSQENRIHILPFP